MRARTRFGGIVLALLVVMAALAPLVVAPQAARQIDLAAVNAPIGTPGHWLGTDYLGRDLAAQAIWGARASLAVGLSAALLAVAVGALWGAAGALAGGTVAAVMMRIVDGLLSIPGLILLLSLESLISTPALALALPPRVRELLGVSSYSFGLLPFVTLIAVVSATSWLEAARLTYGQVLALKSQEYVVAAKAVGVSFFGMLARHLLPNVAPIVVVEGTLLVSDAILMEAGLSFLGLGLSAETPSWGLMLASAQPSLIEGNWWAALLPGLMIAGAVAAINSLGEGLVDLTGMRSPRVAGRSAL